MERHKKNDSKCETYVRSNYRPNIVAGGIVILGSRCCQSSWRQRILSFGNYLLLGQSPLWNIYCRSNCRWSNNCRQRYCYLGSNYHLITEHLSVGAIIAGEFINFKSISPDINLISITDVETLQSAMRVNMITTFIQDKSCKNIDYFVDVS